MKKFLSILLTAAMLLSLVIVASVPASAVDGMWVTYASPSAYEEYEQGESENPPMELGYKYTEEGFTTVDCDWTERMPFGTVQSRDPVSIEDGVYMKVRVDRYAHDGGNDAWINISFWDSQNIKPGSKGYGQGVQTLIRPGKDSEGNWGYTNVNWWIREWSNAGTTQMLNAEGQPDFYYPDENGAVIFEVELTNNGGAYTLKINGAECPSGAMTFFGKNFAEGEAYIGITLHNTTLNSNAGLTILEFGTSKETATVPQGDDYKDPINVEYEAPAEIADPSTVPAGQPAIFMTGDKENTHTGSYSAGQGDSATANDDFSVHVVDTNDDIWNSTQFNVKNEVSYDIDDFPVMMFLTRDFCTCDDPEDCYATEACCIYVMAGDMRAPASNGCIKTPEIELCWEPIIIDEGEKEGTYLYFWFDTSAEMSKELADWSGRIHGTQFNFSSLVREEGRNVIDICWVAFFRSVEEGEAFVMNYLGVNAEEDTTEEPADDTTETPAVDTTETPAIDTTEAPDVDDTTEAKGDDKPEEKTDDKGDDKPEEKTDPKGDDKPADKDDDKTDAPAQSGSCGGVIGAGAIAVIALVASCGAVVLKKKED